MNISEKPQWENSISMVARQQRVEGGRDGAANIQAQQLANRTRFLKQSVEAYSTLIKSGELPYSNEDEAKSSSFMAFLLVSSSITVPQTGHLPASSARRWPQFGQRIVIPPTHIPEASGISLN